MHTDTPLEQQPPLGDDDEIDLLELWDILVGKWRWIVGSTLGSALIAAAVAMSMTPIYRAEVLIVGAEESKGGGGLGALAGQFGGLADLAGINVGGGSKNEALAILKSRQMIGAFIDANKLMPILFEANWNADTKTWKSDDPKALPTQNDAILLFTTSVMKVEEDKKAGNIRVVVEWKDRELAAAWANDLVKRTNEAMQARAIAEAQAQIEYLNKELLRTSVVDIQQAIYRLLEANLKTISVASARAQYAFKVIDPAVAPDLKSRERPKRKNIVLLSAAAGGFIGILGVFLQLGYANLRARRIVKSAKPEVPTHF